MDTSFNEFLSQNAWWLALIAASLILITILAIVIPYNIRKKKKGPVSKIDYKNPEKVKTSYYEALGGEDNLIEHSIEGSRIKIRLNNYDLLDKEKIKEVVIDLYQKYSENGLPSTEYMEVERYSRRALAGKYAKLLDRAND